MSSFQATRPLILKSFESGIFIKIILSRFFFLLLNLISRFYGGHYDSTQFILDTRICLCCWWWLWWRQWRWIFVWSFMFCLATSFNVRSSVVYMHVVQVGDWLTFRFCFGTEWLSEVLNFGSWLLSGCQSSWSHSQ